jgi:hypothetical protein
MSLRRDRKALQISASGTLSRGAPELPSGVVATTYFTFQTSTGPSGLVRRRVAAEADTLERVSPAPHEWVEDSELIRHFADPGDSTLEKISGDQAKVLADRYGVTL